jgi:signal transduction histidine kinase
MRERLIAAFVLVAVFILLVSSIARAYALKDLVERTEALKVEQSVALVSIVLAERQQNDETINSAYLRTLLGPEERARYTSPDGSRVSASTSDFPKNAASNAVSHTSPIGGGGSVTLYRAQHLFDEAISDALLPVVLLGLFLVALAALLGYFAARWIARPFQELARIARDLGRGRFDVHVPRFSMPEADTVGRALETSASQLQALVVREREFASNASHQLRTPITALRLELEDLSLWKETPPQIAEQLHRAMRELDRLSASVTNLLELARGRRVGVTTDFDVCELVEEAVVRWEGTANTQNRRVSAIRSNPLRLRLAPGPIEQILDVLVDNALRHGIGTVSLDVSEFEEHVRVRVSDEGQVNLTDVVFRRGDHDAESEVAVIGLAVASEIAAALGGHLTLDRGSTTSFSLMLPKT